jgi:hypothetical protein
MSDEWIKTLADRRRVKFTNQELDERAFLTAQVAGNKVVYSIVLTRRQRDATVEAADPVPIALTSKFLVIVPQGIFAFGHELVSRSDSLLATPNTY